jgi:hypothetical protein
MVCVDLVIARYNENLNWVAETTKDLEKLGHTVRVFIYNKGDVLAHLKNIFLPNVGRESHTYLYHIVNNYEEYSDSTREHKHIVFLQGDFIDHTKTWFQGYVTQTQLICGFVNDSIKHNASISWAKKHERVGMNAAIWDFRIDQHNGKQLEPRADSCFGEWFVKNVEDKKHFQKSGLLNWWIAGLFAVNSSLLTQKPKIYFSNLLDQLNHIDPEIGHFFERSWVYITNAHTIANDDVYTRRNGRLL